jgi:hypothetical protein
MADNGFGKIGDEHTSDGNGPKLEGVQVTKTVCARYDFAVDGAGVAGADLGLGVYLPPGALVVNVILDVLTTPVGPTNVSVGLVADADLVADAAIAGAPWTTATPTLGKPDWATVGDYVQATVAKTEIYVTPTVAAFSAGKFDVYVTYIMLKTA